MKLVYFMLREVFFVGRLFVVFGLVCFVILVFGGEYFLFRVVRLGVCFLLSWGRVFGVVGVVSVVFL